MNRLQLIAGLTLAFAVLGSGAELRTYKATYEGNLEGIVLSQGPKTDALGQQYTKALQALLGSVKKAGDFDKTTAVIEEIERFGKEKSVPDKSTAFPELKNLQSSYIRQELYNETEKAKKIISLVSKYDDALDSLQRSLVSSSNLADAKHVKDEREAVQSSAVVVAARAAVDGASKQVAAAQKATPPAPAPAKPVFRPSLVPVKSGLTEEAILGDWIYENSRGGFISKMVFKKVDEGAYDLVRTGGGPLAVSGKYTIEGGKLQKGSMSWHYKKGILIHDSGKWKDWILRRPKKK